MPEFIPGLKLCELFYRQAVKPVLDADFPQVQHAAALIGHGSEVLDFDTPMSTDHHWGPRVMLFVSEDDHRAHAGSIREMLRHKLPVAFMGYPTNFTEPDPDDNGTQQLQAVESGPVNHRVEVLTARGYFMDDLNFDPDQPIEAADWLTFPEQKLRSITAGAVYYDGIGLNSLRARFAYYPRDVWLYLLASGWARIGQEEAFVGRTGDLNDELGSQIIAARLVRDMMRLCFLMERVYAPYPKWFGTAFARLKCGRMLNPLLRRALLAANWKEREQHLCAAYTSLAEMHNLLEITPPLPTEASNFHGRPFRVIHGERFADAIRAAIEDEAVRHIAQGRLIGSVDQFSDNTDLLENPGLRLKIKALYG